jgi:hypothetical protein
MNTPDGIIAAASVVNLFAEVRMCCSCSTSIRTPEYTASDFFMLKDAGEVQVFRTILVAG